MEVDAGLGILIQVAAIQMGVIDFRGIWIFFFYFPLSNLNFFWKEQMLFVSQWVWQCPLAGEQAVLLTSCGHN